MNDDVLLEEELRLAAELFDPVPSHLLQAAVEAYTFRTMDAELADLAFDSLAEPVTVRGGDGPRSLTFSAPAVTVDLEITFTGTAGRVVGQLIPPQHAEIEIHGGRPVTVTADSLGRFTCDDVPTGPFSLRCRLAGTVLVTEWITV